MQPINVLLVDDNEDILEFVSINLRAAHLVVEAASSGEEALRMLEYFAPEVIVSDVTMPGMSGYELCRRVRTMGLDEIPFIFLSVLGDPEQRILGLRCGADDYVAKSAEPEEFLLRVRRQIERYRKLRLLRELAESKKPFGIMNGTLDEISMADLLQVVGLLGMPDLCVHVESPRRGTGEIFTSCGELLHATAEGFTGEKALHRLLAWDEGNYCVLHKTFDGAPTVDRSIEACLLEGLSILDYKRKLAFHLGSEGALLAIHHSSQLFTRSFDEQAASVLSLIDHHPTLDAILAHSEISDLETLRVVDELLRTGILICSPKVRTVDHGGSSPL